MSSSPLLADHTVENDQKQTTDQDCLQTRTIVVFQSVPDEILAGYYFEFAEQISIFIFLKRMFYKKTRQVIGHRKKVFSVAMAKIGFCLFQT